MTLDEIFTDEAIEYGLMMLEAKKNSCGVDGVMLHELREHLRMNNIRAKLVAGEYEPVPASFYEIDSKSGNKRKLCKFSSVDRLVLKVLAGGLYDVVDAVLTENCISYRRGKGTENVCDFIRGALDAGCKYVVKIDMKDFFDNINHEKMIALLRDIIVDAGVLRLIKQYIEMPVEKNFVITRLRKGLLQGSSLSPVFSNLYMSDFDRYVLTEITKHFYRFSDDIAVFCETKEQAVVIYESCVAFLRNRLFLGVNKNKSGIFPLISQKYLGYSVVENIKDGGYEVLKIDRQIHTYNHWHTSGLRQFGETYELIENGILTKSDQTIVFDTETVKVHIPVNRVKNINLYSTAGVSGAMLEYLAAYGITLTIFNKYGNIVGRFVPESGRCDATTLLNQVTAYNDVVKRLEIATLFVEAEIFNIKANLKYYKKHYDSVLFADAISSLNEFSQTIKNVKNIERLMTVEAGARNKYFSCFNDMLPSDDFFFSKRTRRPPEDALNALISFGNTVLYNYISNEIHKTSLNVKIGFLHATNRRAESLNLDIAEIFKPIIVDRVIFTLINKHIINEKLHFEYDGKKVCLTPDGKRIFLRQYYKKMDSTFSLCGESVSYRDLIWREIIKFRDFVNGKSDYSPFHYYG